MSNQYVDKLNTNISPEHAVESHQPRIAFLYVPDERPVFVNPQQLSAWMQSFSELEMLCHSEAFFVQPSVAHRNFDSITHIFQQILTIYDQFDGFVVILPRDQVLPVSAMMSLSVTQTGKPIVCTSDYATGMQTRFRDYHSTALKGDLVNAAHVAGANIGTVVTMAGVEIVHPALAMVTHNADRPFITSATNKRVGVIDFGIRIYSRIPQRRAVQFQYETWNFEAVQYVCIDEQKLSAVKQKDFTLQPDARGLIAEISGVAPLSLLAALPKNVPVLITSQDGVQLSFSGAVSQLKTPYTHQAVVAQFVRVIAQQAELGALSMIDAIAAMQQQKFPALTARI